MRGALTGSHKQTLNSWIPNSNNNHIPQGTLAVSNTLLSASHNLGAVLHPFLRRGNRGGRSLPKVTSLRVVRQRRNVYPEACSQLPAHLQKMPEGGELRSTYTAPGNPAWRSRPPRPAGSPGGTGHGGARPWEGPEGGPVGVPRPPRTTRPGRERASERPGPPRLTRLVPTPGERKRYSPAKTLRLQTRGLDAGAGPAPGG